MDTKVELRIETELKEAARRRAQHEGHDLSTVVRALLEMWVNGDVDLDAMRPSELPSQAELAELIEKGAALRDAASTFLIQYRELLNEEHVDQDG